MIKFTEDKYQNLKEYSHESFLPMINKLSPIPTNPASPNTPKTSPITSPPNKRRRYN